MRPRIRSLTGVLALAAMTVAFAETVAVATCGPGMMQAAETSAESAGDVESSDVESSHAMHTGSHDSEPDRDGDDGPHCPFGPAAAVNCASGASIPAHGLSTPSGAVGLTAAVFIEPAKHDLLLPTALFHPPRA